MVDQKDRYQPYQGPRKPHRRLITVILTLVLLGLLALLFVQYCTVRDDDGQTQVVFPWEQRQNGSEEAQDSGR